MRVLLKERIANLGNVGDQVTVKSGYGRNFLLPFSKAVLATEKNLAEFETSRAELEKAAHDKLQAAKDRANKLGSLTVNIEANAGDEGKLFGSVGPRDIAESVTKAGVQLAKTEVSLPKGPIRQTGEYEIVLQLHSEVVAKVKINIVPAA